MKKSTTLFAVALGFCGLILSAGCSKSEPKASRPVNLSESQQTVVLFVTALTQGSQDEISRYADLNKLHSYPRHNHSLESLKRLFSDVNPEELVFQQAAKQNDLSLFARTMSPICLDFKLEKQEDGLLRIIRINP